MNTPVRPVPALVEPSVIAASANERLSITHFDDGDVIIRDGDDGSVTVPRASVAEFRLKLLRLDHEPCLWPAEFTPVPVDDHVTLFVCSDGTVIVRVGTGYPYATVQLEIGDVGIVARALG